MAIGFSAGVSDIAGTGLGLGISLNFGPDFINIPVPGNGQVLYGLAIRAPGQSLALVTSYTFPISPQSVQKLSQALSTVYDTAPGLNQYGVQRSIDKYGTALPYFAIEGTTGWQRHSTDGFGATGLQSIATLQSIFAQYQHLNEQQVQNNIPQLYSMEFYDYFTGEFWQIEPVGPQGVLVDASRPLYYRYQFRWAAVRNVAAPPPDTLQDPIVQAFATVAAVAAAILRVNLQQSLTRAIGIPIGVA